MDDAPEWIRPGAHSRAMEWTEGNTVLPGMELMGCPELAVPAGVMHHVVRVESSFNPYAIGVVGGRLARQPANLPEAVATARMLESRGYNFSLGLAQVNRYNLSKYGLASYEQAFQACPNLKAGSRILAECHERAGHDWGKSFSCYYSGNFVTGFRQGYVQKIYASMRGDGPAFPGAIAVYGSPAPRNAAALRRTGDRPVRPPATLRVDPASMDTRASEGRRDPELGGPAPGPRATLAVLRPAGEPPRMVAPPATPDAAAAAEQAPRDAAFVF
jgi:type IV secretion system protein VirB1